MISHRHRLIYVSIPKCASTTVREWLLAHAGARHTSRPFWYPGPRPHRIQALARVLELYPDYITFTFLRNPYSRFVSLYRHAGRYMARRARRLPGHAENAGTPREFAGLCQDLLADVRGLWGRRATAFLRRNANRRYGPLAIPLRDVAFVFSHLHPQVDFLPDCNPERLLGVPRKRAGPLAFIGAVERLDKDFGRLQARLGLPPAPLSRRNVSPGRCGALEALRGDAVTRRLIERLWAEDFAFAGYPAGTVDARAHGLPRAGASLPRAGPSAAMRARRLAFSLTAAEIALTARLLSVTGLRRRLAPLRRLGQRLARRRA